MVAAHLLGERFHRLTERIRGVYPFGGPRRSEPGKAEDDNFSRKSATAHPIRPADRTLPRPLRTVYGGVAVRRSGDEVECGVTRTRNDANLSLLLRRHHSVTEPFLCQSNPFAGRLLNRIVVTAEVTHSPAKPALLEYPPHGRSRRLSGAQTDAWFVTIQW